MRVVDKYGHIIHRRTKIIIRTDQVQLKKVGVLENFLHMIFEQKFGWQRVRNRDRKKLCESTHQLQKSSMI